MRPLVWFRSDLRLDDQPALHAACAEATRGVVGVFLVADTQWREHDWGAARARWTLANVAALSARLARIGIPLLLRRVPRYDDAAEELLDLARRQGCDGIFLNRELEWNERRRDAAVLARFAEAGLVARAFDDQTLVAPGAVRTGAGGFYTVFTPFRRRWERALEEGGVRPLGAPRRQPALDVAPDEVPEAAPDCDAGTPGAALAGRVAGEAEAQRRLDRFVAERIAAYAERRDRPDLDGTSTLSPWLAVGAISVRRCLARALAAQGDGFPRGTGGIATWVGELAWRDFYRHVLVGFPRVGRGRAFRIETERVPWRDDAAGLEAWCAGRTGFPIVDAAMRRLAETGWMHNRLRMIVASFLAKDLLIDWRHGERWFMRALVDGDHASNNGGWQWAASTGTDAAPYFRVFSPVRQAARFDPEASYIRAALPELAAAPTRALHDPTRLDPGLRRAAGYPSPIVDHDAARVRAIDAFRRISAR